VFIVVLQEDELVDDAKEHMTRLGLGISAAWDRGGAVAAAYQVATIPSVYVMDKSASVRFVHAGYQSDLETTLEHEIEMLSKER